MTTISAARLNANRRNARRSTGPITESGKHRSRLNARTHGLRAESDAVAPDEAEAVADRSAAWAPALPAGDDRRRWLASQLILASVRIDRCQERQRAQAAFEADRASSCWEADRQAEAERLGSRLGEAPTLVVAQLCRFAAGIDWLLDRWRLLADLLDAGKPWDDAQLRLCLDLMQVPEPFRDAHLPRLAALPAEELRSLSAETIASLETLLASASRIDQADRSLAEAGLPTSEGPEQRRLRRYEAALWRRLRGFEAMLDPGRGPDPDPDDLADDIPDLPDEAAPLPVAPSPPPRPVRQRPSPAPAPSPVSSASMSASAPCLVSSDDAPATLPARGLAPSAAPTPRNRRERRALRRAMAGRHRG